MANDTSSLTRFLGRNKEHRAVFAAMLELAGRTEAADGAVTVDELEAAVREKDPACSRQKIIDFCRDLDKDHKAGDFTIGRRGAKTRFIWRRNLDLETLRYTVLGDAPAPEVSTGADEARAAVPAPSREPDPSPVEPGGSVRTIRHTFVLRPDFSVDLVLPVDFNEHEARRMSQMILSLPMDPVRERLRSGAPA